MTQGERPSSPAPALDSLTAGVQAAAGKGPPPVHLWNPAYCGEIDMRIAADGTWFYMGTPIGRPALVKLFASVLRKDPERFVLVTPVERVGIRVDDAPFVAVAMETRGEGAGRALAFRTNVDDWVIADSSHPLRFEREATGGLRPYVLVRGELWARVSRPVFYDLVELGEERDVAGVAMFGVASAGTFFPMAEAAELAAQLAAGEDAP
ncbi:DUF1285 domain-containing protein [Alsobacter ponti]